MRKGMKAAIVILSTVFFNLGVLHGAAAASLQNENLIAAVPNGFVRVTQGDRGSMTIAEYVPRGETAATWSQMVTVQVFHALTKADPDKFAQGIKAQWLKACDDSEVHEVKDGPENGYAASLWVFGCPLNAGTGKPENTFMKFIGGNDGLYSVQYAFRSVLTPEMAASAIDYFKTVRACDTRLVDRTCPAASP